MRISQGHLNLLELCPRKFQQTYVEQLGLANSPDQQERLLAGSRFHALMQQWEMDLPIAPFLQEDPQLRQWFHAFMGAAPKILQMENPRFRESEHLRTLEFNGHLLTVVYDLLILTQSEAQILDWKTYPKPSRKDLSQNWQTRLYLFVLAEMSEYEPEQISMTYWFFQAQGDTESPQSLKFSYSTKQHEETRQQLGRALSQLDEWLDRYETQNQPFPQISETAKECSECNFGVRCQRSLTVGENLPLDTYLSLTEIEEVPL